LKQEIVVWIRIGTARHASQGPSSIIVPIVACEMMRAVNLDENMTSSASASYHEDVVYADDVTVLFLNSHFHVKKGTKIVQETSLLRVAVRVRNRFFKVS
jgi:hypothetical protein